MMKTVIPRDGLFYPILTQIMDYFFLLAITNHTFIYCKFANFRENFIFANSAKRHICDVKKSRTGQDLPISVNDRVISSICKGLIFTKLRICEVSRKLNSRENFRIYSTEQKF